MDSLFMLLGSFFIAVAALGVFRMPELYARMHSSTKAGTLGLGLILLSVVIHFDSLGIGTRAFATLIFVVLTAPVGAHVVGRAAYYTGVPLWKETLVDEIQQWKEKTSMSVKLDD